MIKSLFLGVWATIVSLGAVFAMMTYQNGHVAQPEQANAAKFTLIRTRTLSVPILDAGRVLGYVIARFEFSVDAEKVKDSVAQPESLVADEAFKLVYGREAKDATNSQKHDLRTLTKAIADGVNKRTGSLLIKDVLIDTWSYLSKEDLAKLNDPPQH